MNQSRLTYLFQAYFDKSATPEERDEFMDLLAGAEHDEQLKNLLDTAWQQFSNQHQPVSENKGSGILANILQKDVHNNPAATTTPSRLSSLRLVAAAILLFLAVTGTYFWLHPAEPLKQATQTATAFKKQDPIVPGGNKALLTLSDGSRIALDSTRQGVLVNQGNASVVNLRTAVLAYNASHEKNRQTVYNTLSTSGGGQYQLVLSDGTKVWLNASSSIRFPTVFTGDKRNVTITGEAYFEVARNAAAPFTIAVKDMEVQVLGTHFNIMAYDDEQSVNTTLLEGSVKVSKGASYKMLSPGQESRIGTTGEIKVMEADTEEVMAWKNGWFQFNAYDIEKVMRQIARWYNVEIVYRGQIPSGHFSGSVSRANNISQVLKILEAGGVLFTIEGKKITVSKDHLYSL